MVTMKYILFSSSLTIWSINIKESECVYSRAWRQEGFFQKRAKILLLFRRRLWTRFFFDILRHHNLTVVEVEGLGELIVVTWHYGVVVVTTAQLHSWKPELRFSARWSPARGVSEICDGKDLWQWSRLEIRLHAFRHHHSEALIDVVPQLLDVLLIFASYK